MTTPPRELDLFVFLDAYGWDIAHQFPILEDLCPHKVPLETVLGYSSAAVPTILSGRLPRDHGHWSFFYYDPERSPFRPLRWLRFLPRALTSRARVRNILSRWLKRFYGYTGYFQIYNLPFEHAHLFDYCEKRNFYDQGGLNEGRTIFDELLDSRVPFFCSDRRFDEATNVERLDHELASAGVPIAWLKLASLDTVIHSHGVSATETRDRIHQYQDWIRRLMKTATDRYSDVRLHAFSDHGQVDVASCHDLMGDVEDCGLVYRQDYVATYDSTLGRFWYLREEAREPMEARLRELDYGRILDEEEKCELGVDFPGNRFGETIFLMDAAKLIVPSHMGERPITAMHGYHPRDAGSDGILMSNRAIAPEIRHIKDIYTLMRQAFDGLVEGQPSAADEPL